MPQSVPVSEIAVDHAENAHDLFERIIADGHICPDEITQMREALDVACFHVQRADLARAFGVCLLRGGMDGKRARELAGQWEEMETQFRPVLEEPLDAA